uniref:Uncharacterized protein n=1 Tax=Manihot esculenta TaxID=3983 RepID=A0A2C9W0E7_MANES
MWQLLLAAAGSATFVAKHFLAQERPKEEENPFEDSIASAFQSPLFPNHGNGCGYDSNFQQPPDGIFRFSSSASASSPSADIILCSADSSLFGCGLGIGIMYMMSAEKAEISKLSNAMDETAKTVKELRTELYKRRSAKVAAISKDLSSNNELEFYRVGTEHNNDPKVIKVYGIPMIDDVECPNSGLIEEPEPRLLEMDQLEAELTSELQKLPWSYPEASGHEGVEPNMDKSNISCQCHGVLPSEPDWKLSHLLIKQQENQIEELESELHSAQSKLHEKEAELQALRDCVKLLTEISPSTVSGKDVCSTDSCNPNQTQQVPQTNTTTQQMSVRVK